jgi:hypothetical protein
MVSHRNRPARTSAPMDRSVAANREFSAFWPSISMASRRCMPARSSRANCFVNVTSCAAPIDFSWRNEMFRRHSGSFFPARKSTEMFRSARLRIAAFSSLASNSP